MGKPCKCSVLEGYRATIRTNYIMRIVTQRYPSDNSENCMYNNIVITKPPENASQLLHRTLVWNHQEAHRRTASAEPEADGNAASVGPDRKHTESITSVSISCQIPTDSHRRPSGIHTGIRTASEYTLSAKTLTWLYEAIRGLHGQF